MAGKNEGNNVLVIPNEVFFCRITESLAAGRNVTFTVKGYSMFPFMRNEKDRVCLERYDGRELSAGEVILFRYNGKYILHRVYASGTDAGGSPVYRTMGDGNIRGVEYAVPSAVAGVMICRITPGGKEWKCSSFSWKTLSWVWRKLLFVRRWCLAVLRRVYR